MFKQLWLSIKGAFRNTVNENTDLRTAGREHIYSIKQSIEEVRAQRNALAGDGILAEREVESLEAKVKEFTEAVKYYNNTNDTILRDKSYEKYKEYELKLGKARQRVADIKAQVDKLDAQIAQLGSSTDNAKFELDKAASEQLVGKASHKVEQIHSDITNGPLGGVIETASRKAATAEASRIAREDNDESKLLDFANATKVKSMDDILGAKSEA